MKQQSESLTSLGNEYMTDYGLKVLLDRSIPALSDGLKPVQRRILWAMQHDLNLKPKSKPIKCAKIVGSTLGNYHAHGDAPIYGSLVNMINNNQPYAMGESNFGSLTGGPSPYRYTEATFTEYGFNNFFGNDQDKVIAFKPNYDMSGQEPIELPSNTCNILVNGSFGIAVGATTDIPSFTLESVNELIKKAIKKKKGITEKDVIETLEFKLPYGGMYERNGDNRRAFLALAKTGQGAITFKPGVKIDEAKKQATITKFTNHMQTSNVLERMSNAAGVKLVEDLSSFEGGPKIVVTLEKNVTDVKAAFKRILKPLYSKRSFKIAYVVQDSKAPMGMRLVSSGIIQLIKDWLVIRRDLATRVLKWQLSQQHQQEEKLSLLQLAHKHRDVLDKCRDQKDPAAYLKSKLKLNKKKLDDTQTNTLLSMTVRQLTKLYLRDLNAEMKQVQSNIDGIKKQLKDVDSVIVKMLKLPS